MIWALLIVMLAGALLMALAQNGLMPWAKNLRREHAGVANRAEWMAAEDHIQRVEMDYLAAHRWLCESALHAWHVQAAGATTWLTGTALRRHQSLIEQYQAARGSCYVGILRVIHAVEVRQFSEDGMTCYAIDRQTQRRMATYDYHQQTRTHTQDMGDAALVYRMVYDRRDRRWKIDSYIQELPSGWGNQSLTSWVSVVFELPPTIGRDS